MNIDQRIRSILWPVTFFLFINTLAIYLFVIFRLDVLEDSLTTLAFRVCVLVFSIAIGLKTYLHLEKLMSKEHDAHILKKHSAHKISITQAVLIVIEHAAIGFLQALFIFISGVSFWLIVNFTKEQVTVGHTVLFFAGLGVILLASAYALTHRVGLAVLSIRK